MPNMPKRTVARTASEFYRLPSSNTTSPIVAKPQKATQRTKAGSQMVAARSKLSISEALEKAFPCADCARYMGNADQHFAICPSKYRGRALDFAKLIGAL